MIKRYSPKSSDKGGRTETYANEKVVKQRILINFHTTEIMKSKLQVTRHHAPQNEK